MMNKNELLHIESNLVCKMISTNERLLQQAKNFADEFEDRDVRLREHLLWHRSIFKR